MLQKMLTKASKNFLEKDDSVRAAPALGLEAKLRIRPRKKRRLTVYG